MIRNRRHPNWKLQLVTHTQTAHIMRACAHTRRDHTYCNRRHKCHRHHAHYGKTGTRRETGRVDIEKEADGEGERRRETVRETERERERSALAC